ncbi:MAG: hypothetical protein WD942_04640 [Dehalococcoidia bacterium]
MARQVGPIEYRQLPNGRSVPLYLVRYDKDGTCETPRTLQHLLDELGGGPYTDVYVFSHGWPNGRSDSRDLEAESGL